MAKSDDAAIPTGLSRKGRNAAQAILKVLKKHNPNFSTGGCKLFYSPKEWRERGEQYGLESELIVVYDGGDAYHYFSYMSDSSILVEEMIAALHAIGVYSEACTGWYSAIYT